MAYTVHELAKLSGVTVRTLHFYDELGLLAPAYHGANGYRYYEEKQLLLLQQILFFRELGFDLKQIKKLIAQRGFDVDAALKAHREALQQSIRRTRRLIRTIDNTLAHREGKKRMKAATMFEGFDEARQAEHERYLVNRFGKEAEKGIAESRMKVKNWSKADWEKSGAEWNGICQDLVRLMKANACPESSEVQKVIGKHFEWLKNFWTPNKDSYAGHAELIVDSDLRNAYDKYDPNLAGYMARGIKAFAARLA